VGNKPQHVNGKIIISRGLTWS